LYRAFFTLPDNGPKGAQRGLAYSFEVGDALVAVLDSTAAAASPFEARRQAAWLDETLANSDRSWKLVMFHHPLYASHPWRDNPTLREAWAPVMDRRAVDLVLQGHDHAYLRTHPLRDGRRVEAGAGTIYVVSVSGDKYVDQDPRDYTAVGFTRVSTYQTIDVLAESGRLVYRSFDAEGRERDAFTLQKRPRRDALAGSERRRP
jgi:3',5'-cyclic AMP phosphodiesterase CpdA